MDGVRADAPYFLRAIPTLIVCVEAPTHCSHESPGTTGSEWKLQHSRRARSCASESWPRVLAPFDTDHLWWRATQAAYLRGTRCSR